MRLGTLFIVYLLSTAAAISSPFAISAVDKRWRRMMPVNSESPLESPPELHTEQPRSLQPIPVCAAPAVAKDYYYDGGDFAVGSDPGDCAAFLPDFKVLHTSVGEDGTLYLEGKSDGQNSLRVYSRTGDLKWAVPIDEIENPLAVAPDGTTFLMATLRSSSTLTAYNPDGTVRWRVQNEGEQFGDWIPPAIGPDGTIYVFSGVQPGSLPDCRSLCPAILAITPQGQERWRVRIPRRPKDVVVDADGRILVNVPSGNLIAFDPQGHQLWRFNSEDKFGKGGIAVAADRTIYFASRFLYAIDLNGKARWVFKPQTSYTEGEDFQDDPVIAEDGTVYAYSRHHELYAITPGGRKKWVISNLPSGGSGVELSSKGILRTPSAWFSVSSGLASHGWPSANRDARNSRSQEAR
jgi:outer membrane protein assembly factor BamB